MKPLGRVKSVEYKAANLSVPVEAVRVIHQQQPFASAAGYCGSTSSIQLQPEPRANVQLLDRATPADHPILQQFDQSLQTRPLTDLSSIQLDPLSPPHISVNALAGTGKTFTILEACYRMAGIQRPGIVGSEEQEAIWAAMPEQYNPASIYMVAFNRKIANVLKDKVPPNVIASTAHGFGKRLLGINKIGTGKYGVYQKKHNKTFAVMCKLMNLEDKKLLFQKFKGPILFAIAQVVSLLKVNLVTLSEDYDENIKLIDDLLMTHGVTLPEFKSQDDKEFLYLWSIQVYNRNHEFTRCIDFDDMIWMPWRLGLRGRPYEVMFVDERQDLNLAQQELVFTNAKRLIMVGDSNQAVYGFAGADVAASERMNERLAATNRGVKVFPLTYTYRCSKAVVRFNQSIVEDFHYFETNREGGVYQDRETTFLPKVRLGEMVVCRTNAPLFSCCLQLMVAGIPFRTTITEFFQDILKLIASFDADSIPDLLDHLEDWRERQLAKCTGAKQDYAIIIEDQVEAIKFACRQVSSVPELLRLLKSVFKIKDTDSDDSPDDNYDSGPDPRWIFLTSIHQSKGLEAERVWWLRHDQVPHPKAKLIEQEINLRWVAGTRPLLDLILVDSVQQRSTLEDELNYE